METYYRLGFTIPQVDKILAPYAEKSYYKYYNEYINLPFKFNDANELNELEEDAENYATKKVRRDFEQGFQGWEYKFNTVGSSRGDYPFIAISFGIGTSKWETMASEVALETRANGQGKKDLKNQCCFQN